MWVGDPGSGSRIMYIYPIAVAHPAGCQTLRTITRMAIHLHHDDLPDGIDLGTEIAIDTETMGLNPHRDRLCLVQLSAGDGDAHLVKMAHPLAPAPHLAGILADPAVTKLFHFARFDLAALAQSIGAINGPIYCTKIASKLCRTYTDRHGLKDLCAELIGVEISKQQQSSDWGAETLSEAQQTYAASDVLYLHRLRAVLDEMLAREGRTDIARACFEFLPVRAGMDLGGFADLDIFHH
jgi:ribonuclease D